eukprot:sb/3471935/
MGTRSQSYRNFIVKAFVFLVSVGFPVASFWAVNEYRGVNYSGWKVLDNYDSPNFALDVGFFLPLWYTMFSLFGIASFVLWYTNGLLHNLAAFVIATIKLLLVLVWFPLLFYWENIMATFIGSCVVWVANGVTMIFYAGMFHPSGMLLIPEQIWVSYICVWMYFLWNDTSDSDLPT